MLDKLDLIVISVLALAVAYYFGKDYLSVSDSTNSAGFVTGGSDDERNLLVKLRENGKNCVVFYGSQTGTAEDYAHKLSKELQSKFGLNVLTADLADYDYDNLQELDPSCLLFFMMATYGEGEPTDNAVEFFNWLENDADQMANLKFAVFGLGNSTYEFYNAVASKLNDQFEKLGAERFAPYGQGDDGLGTMDEDFLSWKEECFDYLKTNINLEERELQYEPSFKLIEEQSLDASNDNVSNGEPNKSYINNKEDITRGPFDHLNPYLALVSKSKELYTAKERSCVHIEFDVSKSNLRYTTGDHLAIWPSNSNEAVERFTKCFGLEEKKDRVFSLEALDSTFQLPFPTPITYEAVVRHHFEITGPISRQALKSIAPFAPTEEAKHESMRLGSEKTEFAEKIHLKKFNLADVLLHISAGIPWKDVPFVFLIELIATLQPRYYSISSSSLSEKSTIHVTAVVEAEIMERRMITGVATNLLKDIEVTQNGTGDVRHATYDLSGPKRKFEKFKLPVHVRRSAFKLPSNPSTPIILVGPGTGIAPMRAFVRERVALLKNSESVNLGKTMLFYGCRKRDEDYLYREEWPEYARLLGSTFEMDVAFSREGAKKVYVQDKLLARGKQINELLEEGAFIYVCGDASRMARDVQRMFAQIVSQERSVSLEKASELLRSLKIQNRYQEDVW